MSNDKGGSFCLPLSLSLSLSLSFSLLVKQELDRKQDERGEMNREIPLPVTKDFSLALFNDTMVTLMVAASLTSNVKNYYPKLW